MILGEKKTKKYEFLLTWKNVHISSWNSSIRGIHKSRAGIVIDLTVGTISTRNDVFHSLFFETSGNRCGHRGRHIDTIMPGGTTGFCMQHCKSAGPEQAPEKEFPPFVLQRDVCIQVPEPYAVVH
jgi:hypothetical protein